MPKHFLLALALLCSFTLAAQLPNTQVYVFDFQVRDTTVLLSRPKYLTNFNRRGYNNQPSWINNNQLLMSVRVPGQAQPDIYHFDLGRNARTRLTSTEAGEYSPKPIGSGDRFSAIRQEYLGQDTVLRLWDFPVNLENNGRPVFKYLNGIGYYEWLNSVQLALYQVENPSVLSIASTDNDQARPLATNVGRCFKRQPNGNLAFVDKSSRPWAIREQNLYRMDETPTRITEVLDGSEDFAILSDGSYLMGQGSQLYRYDPIRNPRWVQVADLRLYGIRNITRLETNNAGRLALVADVARR